MAKTYTSQEMRELADAIAGDLSESRHASVRYTFDDLIHVIESLRYAADALEREEKREKRYMYYERWPKGDVFTAWKYRTLESAKKNKLRDTTIIRREEGEWEEVK